MSHIVFITPYYPPEKGAAAIRVSETAERLVKQGYDVTVLTTVPSYPIGVVPVEYRGRFLQKEVLEGVRVIRVWSYATPNKSFVYRVLAQLSFGCFASLPGRKVLDHPDVIIVESHPLFNAIAGRIQANRHRVPFILIVSDLWPASAIQLGVLRNAILIKLAQWLEESTYKRASLIWTLTEGIQRSLLQREQSAERVFLLTNGVDTVKFRPQSQGQARAELHWDNRFTVLYAGNHGLSQRLITVLEAAERLRENADIHIVLVGDGVEKADLVVEARERDLKNVTFLDSQPHELMPIVLASADICLVPLRKISLFEGALPSKMYEVMACARPLILGVEGEARCMIEDEAGAGLVVEPENADALTAAILYLYEHPQAAKAMGRRGRAFVEARFDREQLTSKLEMRIADLLGKKRAGSVSGAVEERADNVDGQGQALNTVQIGRTMLQ